MNNAQEILYGGFPRTVASASSGELRQFFVENESLFDMFVDHNIDDMNLYSSTCRFRSDMRPVLDKCFFDFDSPLKESIFDSDTTDRKKVQMMREDEKLADEVLGLVWKDAQSLVQECIKDNIPVLTVFSGLGVHCHLLYQDKVDPRREKVSISNYYIDKCGLDTSDRKVIPDTRRILRIPNSKRNDGTEYPDVWCIPITEQEVLDNSVHDLLERCKEKKDVPYYSRYKYENRPTMETVEGYETIEEDTTGTVELSDRNVTEEVPELTEWIVRNCIPLPCVRDRFLRENPDHMIRFNGVVFLYQAGFSVEEVRNIIKEIGWIDYDPEVTRKMTKQIYERKYSESSCSKLMSLGLCVQGEDFEEHGNEPSDCETYKWTSGEALY